MAGSLVLSGQPTASLSDKLTELDELQTKAEKQAEEKSRKQAAKEAERKNERKRKQPADKNIRTGAKDKRTGKRDTRPKRPKQSNVNNNNINDSGNNRDIASSRLGTFEATFYTAYCSTGCTGVTATGVDVSNTIHHDGLRVIAVDPAVIPLGTRVKVMLDDGSSFVASAEDKGGDIKGRRIDVLVASKAEARRLGRQKAEVQIIE